MPSRTEHPLPVSPTPHSWVMGSRGAAAAVCLPASPRQPPVRPATHLYPVVGEEGLGVGLGGQVQAGGPAPAAAAAHQQGEGAGLAVAVALGEEACGGPAAGTGRPPPALPRPRPRAPHVQRRGAVWSPPPRPPVPPGRSPQAQGATEVALVPCRGVGLPQARLTQGQLLVGGLARAVARLGLHVQVGHLPEDLASGQSSCHTLLALGDSPRRRPLSPCPPPRPPGPPPGVRLGERGPGPG